MVACSASINGVFEEIGMIGFNTEANGSLLQQVQQKQDSLLEKLASGKRINSASDGSSTNY
jgi:flagellin-like hook-associated protein FlgL